MSLYERYELLDLNRDDGVKTFEAREIATGRPVKVHLFVRPSAPLQAALLKAIDHLSETDLQRILERGKHRGHALSSSPTACPITRDSANGCKPPATRAKRSPPSRCLKPRERGKCNRTHRLRRPAPRSARGGPRRVRPNQQFVELFTTAERPVVADSLVQSAQRPQSAAPCGPPSPC